MARTIYNRLAVDINKHTGQTDIIRMSDGSVIASFTGSTADGLNNYLESTAHAPAVIDLMIKVFMRTAVGFAHA